MSCLKFRVRDCTQKIDSRYKLSQITKFYGSPGQDGMVRVKPSSTLCFLEVLYLWYTKNDIPPL
jgi:hypothetical protein